MRKPNWSALFGSVLAAVLPATQLPPQLPPRPAPPEINWTMILSRVPPPVPRRFGGSRGPSTEIYGIVPGQMGKAEVWSNRPLFLWHGAIRQIEFIQSDTKETVWSQRLGADDRHCVYRGRPLQPGQSYEWVIYSLAKSPLERLAFRVLPDPERDRITAALTALEAKWAGASAETLALQRAYYFAELQLWAEVLREAFSVPTPSAELAQWRSALPERLEQVI